MRTQNDKAKYEINQVIHKTVRLWRGYHLSYDQLRYITKVARQELGIERPKSRRKILERLSIQEQELLIKQAYREPYPRGLILKTLLYSGARVSEFVSIRAEDLYMEEDLLYIREGKGQKSRYVPILPDLVQELLTHLAGRKRGYLFVLYRTLLATTQVKAILKHTRILLPCLNKYLNQSIPSRNRLLSLLLVRSMSALLF
jgi:integrase/recombinase XerD